VSSGNDKLIPSEWPTRVLLFQTIFPDTQA
jgi:hypothetical protein